jgi:hypothetical protein
VTRDKVTVIVCGSRYGQTNGLVYRALDEFDAKFYIAHLVTGTFDLDEDDGGSSTDVEAFRWALDKKRVASIVPADWERFGKAAGPKRNRKMGTFFPNVEHVCAFPGMRGTRDMMNVGLIMECRVWRYADERWRPVKEGMTQ